MSQPQKQYMAALDIGTSAVKSVIAEVQPNGTLHIVGVGNQPSRGLRKGVVINVEATVEAISKAHAQAETMAGFEIESVFSTITGAHLRGMASRGVVGIKGKEVTLSDIERVIEAAKAVAIPADRDVLHVLPQEFVVDEQDGIKEPLGISGVRLEAQVFIVTANSASAENIVKCAQRCGLRVSNLVVAGLGAARAVCWPEEMELGVVCLDIGAGTTDISIFKGGAVKGIATLPIGGNHITADIAVGLRTPIMAAEDIKVRYGCASAVSLLHEDSIEVPSTGNHNARMLSQGSLADIIEPRITEILQLAKKEIEKQELTDCLTSGLVITGGTSQLQGLCSLAQKIYRVPVRLGATRGVSGLAELVSSASFSTAVGLLLHQVGQQKGSESSYARSNPVRIMAKKVGNWFGRHF